MGKCEVFMLSLRRQTDRRTDNGKTIHPRSFERGYKNHQKRGSKLYLDFVRTSRTMYARVGLTIIDVDFTVISLEASVRTVTFISANRHFNSLSDDKILDWSKLKQIADEILKCI